MEERKEFWKWFFVVVGALLILSTVGFVTNSFGYWGRTAVEREVFEASYQRSESIKAQIATDEAVLVEIGMQLSNQGLDELTRINLEAQASAARLRIATAKGRK